MSNTRTIRIAGGGLAGLALGIALRQKGIPTTVIEAGDYPRHRVCGEFISGRGQAALERLHLTELLLAAGAQRAWRTAFFFPGNNVARATLPQGALCVSRYVLDKLLADEFARLGGVLCLHTRWDATGPSEGWVRATGRRPQAAVNGWRWFGLRAHARGTELEADLELHFLPNGYVGLCRVGEEVNVCGLFRSRNSSPNLAQEWSNVLAGPEGSVLRERLGAGQFDAASFRAVAALAYPGSLQARGGEWAVGDALAMIPPVTGNGMSLAFESAELASAPLARYGRGDWSWAAAAEVFAEDCRERFARRLRVAAGLQALLFREWGARCLGAWLPRFPQLIRALFDLTR